MTEPTWQDRANCAGTSLALFFPDFRWDGESPAETQQLYANARAVCDSCEVKAECLDAGLHEPVGMWGGTTPKERQRIRLGRQVPA